MLFVNCSDLKLLFNLTFYIDAILEAGNIRKKKKKIQLVFRNHKNFLFSAQKNNHSTVNTYEK